MTVSAVAIRPLAWENEASRRGAGNTATALTPLLDLGERGLAVDASRSHTDPRNGRGDRRPLAPCAIEGCGVKRIQARGFCATHYSRWKKYGDPLSLKAKTPPATCSLDGCDRVHEARGWCGRHYQRWQATGDPLGVRRKRDPIDVRFEERVDRSGPGGCWLWTGHLTPEGYGYLSVKHKNIHMHRWAFQHFVRPLGEGVVLDHLCRVRHCVNPAHLDPVTQRINMLRGMSPPAIVRRQRVCRRGHHLTEDNIYVPPKNPTHRVCRECMRMAGQRHEAKRKAARQAAKGTT